jgi:YfiH family protein
LGPAEVRFTGREEGDQRTAAVDRPWTRLHQVHGDRVVVVTEPGGSVGEEADAAVTAVPGARLAVLTADCAPVAFASDDGVVGVAHAGWRGLVAGVLERTVEAMRALGADGRIQAALGPCIHAECYEFGADDLDVVAARYGDVVRAITTEGTPALDLPAAVRAALDGAGVELVSGDLACTACSPDHYSFRARREDERQATVVWLVDA